MTKSLLNRINFRLKWRGWTFYSMLAKTQECLGITSKLGEDVHFPLWDLDDCTLEQAVATLEAVQEKYGLGEISVYSDRDDGFLAACFTRMSFNRMLRVLIDTDYLDPMHLSYTARRGAATVRVRTKPGRPPLRVVAVLPGTQDYPGAIRYAVYDTGVIKGGLWLHGRDEN